MKLYLINEFGEQVHQETVTDSEDSVCHVLDAYDAGSYNSGIFSYMLVEDDGACSFNYYKPVEEEYDGDIFGGILGEWIQVNSLNEATNCSRLYNCGNK